MRRATWALLALALAVRMALVLVRDPAGQFPDTQEYRAVADSLRAGRGFLLGTQAQHARPPAYPAFLALTLAASGDSPRGALLAQAMLSALTLLFVVALARRITRSSEAAFVAGALYALDPLSVYFGALELSETLYSFLEIAALERWTRGVAGLLGEESDTPLALPVAGGLVALAALTRAQALALVPLLALAIVWMARPARRAALGALAFVAGAGITLAPWVARNLRVYEGFVPVALGSGIFLYESNNPMFSLVPWPEGIPRPPLPVGLTPEGIDREWRRRAVEYISSHPGETACRAPFQLARLLAFTVHAPGYQSAAFALVLATATIPVYLLAPVGLLELGVARAAPLWITLGLSCALHTVFLGSIRYRVPLMPLLFVLAGAGAVAVRRRWGPPQAGDPTGPADSAGQPSASRPIGRE